MVALTKSKRVRMTHAQAVSLIERARDRGYISQDYFEELSELPEEDVYHPTKRSKSTGNRLVKTSALRRRLRNIKTWLSFKDGVFKLKSAQEVNKVHPFLMVDPSVRKEEGFSKIRNSIYNRILTKREKGELTGKQYAELHHRIRTADSVDALRGVRDGLGWGREPYTSERAALYGVEVGNRPETEWKADLRQRINTADAAAKRSAQTSQVKTLATQTENLAQGADSYARQIAIRGQKRWIRKNMHLLPEGMSIGEYTRNWWERLPNKEKLKWKQVTTPIQEFNKSVMRTYDADNNVAPTSKLLSVHHVMPSGANSPENLRGAIGDAFTDIGSEHRKVHGLFRKDSPIVQFYDKMRSKGATKLYALPELEGSAWRGSPLQSNWPISDKLVRDASGKVTNIARGVPTYTPLPKDLGGGAGTTYGLSDAPADAYPKNLIGPITGVQEKIKQADIDRINREESWRKRYGTSLMNLFKKFRVGRGGSGGGGGGMGFEGLIPGDPEKTQQYNIAHWKRILS